MMVSFHEERGRGPLEGCWALDKISYRSDSVSGFSVERKRREYICERSEFGLVGVVFP